MDLVVQSLEKLPEGTVITLKEITDILTVQHSKAMKSVDRLTKEQAFGEVSKYDTFNLNGVKVKTYALTKIQAIATAAKLDNSQLMKVVTKLEEKREVSLANIEDQRHKIKALLESYDVIGEVITSHHKQIKENSEDIKEVKDYIEEEKRIRPVSYAQQKMLLDTKNRRVYEIANGDNSIIKSAHHKMWSLFKRKFNIPRYSELPTYRFNEGLDYLRNITIADLIA